jgi:hypothetical protein
MQTQTENPRLQLNKKYVVGASEFWYVGIESDHRGIPEHIFLMGHDECISERCIPDEHLRLEGDLVTDITGGYSTGYLRPLTKDSNISGLRYKPEVIEATNKHFQKRLNQLRALEDIAKQASSVKVPPQ